MSFKKHKIKPYGNPDPANINRTSNPKTDGEAVQAIADLIEGSIEGEIVQQMAQRGLMVSDLKYALGTDGNGLKSYDQQLESDFQGVNVKDNKSSDFDRQTAPELKKVSTERAVKINLPGTKPKKNSSKDRKK